MDYNKDVAQMIRNIEPPKDEFGKTISVGYSVKKHSDYLELSIEGSEVFKPSYDSMRRLAIIEYMNRVKRSLERIGFNVAITRT